ncbi:hypothetical protein [Fusobacterium animalis]
MIYNSCLCEILKRHKIDEENEIGIDMGTAIIKTNEKKVKK